VIIPEVVLTQLPSWGWTQGCLKHVEDSNKHIIEEIVRQVGYLPELYTIKYWFFCIFYAVIKVSEMWNVYAVSVWVICEPVIVTSVACHFCLLALLTKPWYIVSSMFLVMCHTCLWAKDEQFQSQISIITNKLHNKFHIFTCIVDYSNLFCQCLIAETFRSSLLYVDKWNLLYSVTYLCVSILWTTYIIKISVAVVYSE